MAKKKAKSKADNYFEVKIDDSGWTGKISIRRLSRIERMTLSQTYLEEVEKFDDEIKKIEYIEKCIDDNVKTIFLKHVESGEKFKSLDELQYIDVGDEIVVKIFNAVIKGRSPGNVLKLQLKDQQ